MTRGLGADGFLRCRHGTARRRVRGSVRLVSRPALGRAGDCGAESVALRAEEAEHLGPVPALKLTLPLLAARERLVSAEGRRHESGPTEMQSVRKVLRASAKEAVLLQWSRETGPD